MASGTRKDKEGKGSYRQRGLQTWRRWDSPDD